MTLNRQVTGTVALTIVLLVLSTVLMAPDAEGVSKEEPLTSASVIQGPPILDLPAEISVTHPTPRIKKPVLALGEAKSATAKIVTKTKVLNYFHAERAAATAQAVIDFAMAQIGDPYVWGGNGPNGWDCSGLMVGAFSSIGVNLPRTSRSQFTVGTPVGYGQWQPGDLLFFGSSAGSIHHVVLYIGNGQIVHASTQGVPVKVDPVSGGGRDYFGAKRVL